MASLSTSVPPPNTDIAADLVVLINLPIATKLSPSNYLAWRAQVLPLLHGYDLAKFIESPPPAPTRQAVAGQVEVNPEFLSWRRQDQLLLGWFRSSLTDSVQSQVISCSSSMEIWLELQKLFSSHSKSRIMELKRKIQCAQKGTFSCGDYLQQLRRVADELASIGAPYPDDELVMAALNGLGSEYNSVVAAVNTASLYSNFTFSDLHGLLLAQEALLQSQLPPATAFFAGRGV